MLCLLWVTTVKNRTYAAYAIQRTIKKKLQRRNASVLAHVCEQHWQMQACCRFYTMDGTGWGWGGILTLFELAHTKPILRKRWELARMVGARAFIVPYHQYSRILEVTHTAPGKKTHAKKMYILYITGFKI